MDHPINERIIGLELAQIQEFLCVIGVAGGPDKFDVIRGALRGHLINVLITDEDMAHALLADLPHLAVEVHARQAVLQDGGSLVNL